jgi:hypothetical protein
LHSTEGDLVPSRRAGLAGLAAIYSFLRQAVAPRLTSVGASATRLEAVRL